MKKKVLVALILILQASCASQEVKYDSSQWKPRMHRLANYLRSLISRSASQSHFNDYENQKSIQHEMSSLKKEVGSLHRAKMQPSNDPMNGFLAKRMKENLHRSLQEFSSGNKEVARLMIRRVSNNCFACHSRTQKGKTDIGFDWEGAKSKKYNPEAVHFYLSLREYDKAVDLVSRFFSGKENQTNAAWELALYQTLAVLVRVKSDPNQAMALSRLVHDKNGIPKYLKNNSKHWIQSLRRWKARETSSSLTDRSNRFTVASQIFRQRSKGKDPMSGFIDNLRASKILHEIVQDSSSPSKEPRLFYLTGLVSENLSATGIDGLGEPYFERCVELSSGGRLGDTCFSSLQEIYSKPKYLDSDGEMNTAHKKNLSRLRETINLRKDEMRNSVNPDIRNLPDVSF